MMDLDDLIDPWESDTLVQQQSERRNVAFDMKLVTDVYRAVWTEFQSWTPTDSQLLIDSLAAQNLIPFRSRLNEHSMDVSNTVQDELLLFDPVTILVFDDGGSVAHEHNLTPKEVVLDESFKPYPTYGSCTPASRSIAPRHDELDVETCRFIPYADDPAFDSQLEEYILLVRSKEEDEEDGVPDQYDNQEPQRKVLKWFAWQTDMKDPDVEVIAIETVRRLHYGHRLSFEDIDRTKILPELRSATVHETGLLWEMFQRDVFSWPGSLSDHPHLTIPTATIVDNLFNHVNRRRKFCPNLNCIHFCCSLHQLPDRPLDKVPPASTSRSMKLSHGEPCGEYCFRLLDESADHIMESTYWSHPQDVDTLAGILKLIPDLLPCDLATLCKKPCNEVYIYRSRLLADNEIDDYIEGIAQSAILGLRRQPRKPRFVDGYENIIGSTPTFIPVVPCSHKGTCDQFSKCSCFKSNQHCQRNCGCGVDCDIRWKGCRCKLKKGRRTCDGKKCPCKNAARECDPELCMSCEANSGSKKQCQNVKIQQEWTEFIEIKQSEFGLGAFATRRIKTGALIGDYIGEQFSNDWSGTRDLLGKHTGLNYLFELNNDESSTSNHRGHVLDSAFYGNETRYLNDGPNPNCSAKILLVNGQHHIGIFSDRDIARGEELTLGYGGTYWVQGRPWEEARLSPVTEVESD